MTSRLTKGRLKLERQEDDDPPKGVLAAQPPPAATPTRRKAPVSAPVPPLPTPTPARGRQKVPASAPAVLQTVIPSGYGYLNPSLKSVPSFKTVLANNASADTRHDFGINVVTQKIQTQFNDALPSGCNSAPTEDEVLNNIINKTSATPTFKDFLTEVTTETSGTELDITFPGNTGGPITKFNVIKYSGTNYGDKKKDIGKDFCEKTNLTVNTENACFVVDFNQHGFLSKLKQGTKTTNTTIHYLMTPEVVNDPAGKPSIFDKTLFDDNKTGVTFKSYIQTTPNTTNYTPYKTSELSFTNNFFSNYNFSLSPIQQSFQKGNNSSLSTTLTISFSPSSGTNFVDSIKDSKKQNSIQSLLSYINGLMKQLGTPKGKFDFNSKLQQKRGGDWLQVLACLNTKDNDFSCILPNKGNTPSGPVYLVTHDRIALAYALLNGVNVIYLSHNKDTFVFKNRYDKIIRENSIPIEQSSHAQILKFKEETIGQTGTSEYATFQIKYNTYDSFRNAIITNCVTNLDEVIGNATSFLNQFKKNTDSMNDTDYIYDKTKGYKTNFKKQGSSPSFLFHVKEIFKKAVIMSFILQTIPDISMEYNFVKTFIDDNFKTDYSGLDNQNKKDLLKVREYINSIKNGAFEVIGPGSMSSGYEKGKANEITNKFTQLIEKSAIWRAIDTLFSNLTANDSKESGYISTFIGRILQFSTTSESNACDQYIFIQSITNLPVETTQQLIECFTLFQGIVIEYGQKLEKTYSGKRSGASPEERAMFFRPANLIYETLLVLNGLISQRGGGSNEKMPETILGEIILNESTDNILLKTDNEERNINKQIKQSNVYDEDDKSNSSISTTGGGISSGKIGIVYDSTINQMVWPLLSDLTNKDYYYDTIVNYLNITINDKTITKENLKEMNINTILDSILPNIEDANVRTTLVKLKTSNISGLFTNIKGVSSIVLIIIICFYLGIFSTNKSSLQRGGQTEDPPSIHIELNSDITAKQLLEDNMFCYHPLVPIYILLTSFYNQMGSELEEDPFLTSYISYFNVLEKMTHSITANYLETQDISKIMEAFIIGYVLRTVFFTANKSNYLFDELAVATGLDADDLRMFCMKNSIFSEPVIGDIVFENDSAEEISGSILLNLPIFSSFINSDSVKFKNTLLDETDIDYESLKNRLDNLLKIVVDKVKIV